MRIIFFTFSFLFALGLWAQDPDFVRAEAEVLSDSTFHGRGYVKDGSRKAAEYIARRFSDFDVLPVGDDFFQSFSFRVNTFETPSTLIVDGKKLNEGHDYIADPRSGASTGRYPIITLDSTHFQPGGKVPKTKGKLPVINLKGIDTPDEVTALHNLKLAVLPVGPMVLLQPDKLTWSVGEMNYPNAVFEVLRAAFPENAKEVEMDLQPREIDFEAVNVVGKIEGRRSDSCVVITAHYDHLGRMGEALFAGASDNGSGVAVMLDLARHYDGSKPKFDTWFIAFAGEEAGLKGSKFFVDNPLFPLGKIKLLINLDLMGSAANGITVVNGRLYPELMEKMAAINTKSELLPKIKLRGKAANSDHYWFSEAGVPAIFIYTEGNITAYHDVNDIASGLDWTNYAEVFTLLTEFIKTL